MPTHHKHNNWPGNRHQFWTDTNQGFHNRSQNSPMAHSVSGLMTPRAGAQKKTVRQSFIMPINFGFTWTFLLQRVYRDGLAQIPLKPRGWSESLNWSYREEIAQQHSPEQPPRTLHLSLKLILYLWFVNKSKSTLSTDLVLPYLITLSLFQNG